MFVLSGKRGGTRAGCAHGLEAQQPGEQAPLSLWGQHTPLSASWKTCHFGQGLSSATSSCLAHSGRRGGGQGRGRLWTDLVRASGQQTVVRSQLGIHPDGCVLTCQPLCLTGPRCLVASWTCRHSGTSCLPRPHRPGALGGQGPAPLEVRACSRCLNSAAERMGKSPGGSELERPGIHRSSAFSIPAA